MTRTRTSSGTDTLAVSHCCRTSAEAADHALISVELHCAPDALRLSARIAIHGDGRTWRPAFGTIDVRLPAAEKRPLTIEQELTHHR
mgnify:CR=1 FL=1